LYVNLFDLHPIIANLLSTNPGQRLQMRFNLQAAMTALTTNHHDRIIKLLQLGHDRLRVH